MKMFKKVAFLSGLLLLSSGSMINVANAASYGVNPTPFQEEFSVKYHVKNFFELSVAINKAQDGDEIILVDDISLDNKVVIKSSICLNLNGHTISVRSDKAGIIIGEEKFDHDEHYTVKHSGEYKWEPANEVIDIPARNEVTADGKVVYIPSRTVEVIKNKYVWHPGRDELCIRQVYTYNDNITVIIKDGKILGAKGQNGKDGVEDSENDYNGEDGKVPSAPVDVISGTLRLSGVKLKGGNGGDGGNGGYQNLHHFIFGGGDAGNGGNGAKGGYALFVRRKDKCSIVLDKSTKLKAGQPGRGGNAGKVNPNYWVYSGYEGVDGKNGKESPAYN